MIFAREREQVDVKDIAAIVQIDGTRLERQGGTSKTQRPLDRDIQPVKGGKHRTIRLVVDDAARVVELEDRRDAINQNAAWYYPEPKQAASNIKGYVAFWKGVQVTR